MLLVLPHRCDDGAILGSRARRLIGLILSKCGERDSRNSPERETNKCYSDFHAAASHSSTTFTISPISQKLGSGAGRRGMLAWSQVWRSNVGAGFQASQDRAFSNRPTTEILNSS